MKAKVIWLGGLFLIMACGNLHASERYLTYTYEPETMPQGAREFEQWVTLRTPRNAAVGQKDYYRWDFREEIEYGVNDDYTLALILDTKYERFRDSSNGRRDSESDFDGVGLENKYRVINPVGHPVGLSLYLEPKVSQDEVELEAKLILGQRAGDWKWALNVTSETSWEDDKTDGVLEVTAGLTRQIQKRWQLGVEFRNHNDIEGYSEWEHSAYFLGPVVSYHRENWWATLSVLGQVFGRNYGKDKDGESNFVLDEHEIINARLIVGIDF